MFSPSLFEISTERVAIESNNEVAILVIVDERLEGENLRGNDVFVTYPLDSIENYIELFLFLTYDKLTNSNVFSVDIWIDKYLPTSF